MADLAVVEARLRAILDPYRDRLEANTLYGVDTLRQPGASAHHFFAGVRAGERHISFHFMPVYSDPALLDSVSPGLRARLQGKTTFTFTTLDEGLFAELEDLTARGFEAYAKRETKPRKRT